jgi:hypothetical protein
MSPGANTVSTVNMTNADLKTLKYKKVCTIRGGA